MHNLIKSFLLLIILINSVGIVAFGKGRLYKVTNINEINNHITELLAHQDPSMALLILPLDIMMIPDHSAFYFKDQEAQEIIKSQLNKIVASKKLYIEEFVLTNYPHKLLDTNLVNFIHNMQQTNLPIMVTTKNLAGSINDIRYLEVWTWNWLYERGINLSNTPIGKKEIRINSGTKKIGGNYPTFFRGLLSCNSYDKSNAPQIVIASLLATKIRWLPSVVYAIDRDEAYLKSLEKQFTSLRPNIQFEGFIYNPPTENSDYEQLSLQELEKFWQDLVVNMNKIKRVELKAKIDDPYAH
ncbi:MAG: hypothetical protein H6909_02420 [Rickettsiaceae bacterium]|nr:hypothetical protein [Rickettsiaceae bacterium]